MTDPSTPRDETLAEAIRVFSIVGVAALTLVLIQALTPFRWWTLLAPVIASLAVLYLCRDALRIEALFPEVGQALDRLTRIVAARRPG